MKQYLDIMKYIMEKGVQKGDRTGTGTISTFGQTFRHKFENGFPLLTTKKIWWKGVVGELLWFISGSTSAKELREKYGVTIWDEWQNPDGYLGKIYSQQWVRLETPNDYKIVEVKINTKQGIDKSYIIPNNNIIVIDGEDGVLTGKIFESKRSGKYKVLEKIGIQNKNSVYNIQFLDTGFITKATAPNIRSCVVNDKYRKNVYGEGCIGEITYKPKYYKKAYDLWYNMMSRCYNVENDNYVFYGGRGVYVDQRWRCFSNFLIDITQIPYFEYWVDYPFNFDLDKDYYKSDHYSKDSCVFLDKNYNRQLNDGTYAYKAVRIKDNYSEIFINKSEFANKYELSNSSVSYNIDKNNTHKGWKFYKIKPKEGHIFRKRIIINQIDYVINELKNNPDSRRIILNAWNVSDLDKMNLTPCHHNFQCYSREMSYEERVKEFTKHILENNIELGDLDFAEAMELQNFPKRYLSLKYSMRSNDFFLGAPFNIASYSLLTYMLSEVTNHIPYEIIGDLGDTHLYTNHLEYAKEQLTREPKKLPKLKIKRRVNDIRDFKFDDFELIDYIAYPNWKNVPIAV